MMKLSDLHFLNAIDWANLDAEATQGAAPGINKVVALIGNHCIFRTYQLAIIATYTN